MRLICLVFLGCAHREAPPPAAPQPQYRPAATQASVNWTAPPPASTQAQPAPLAVGDVLQGKATWYGKVLAGHKTASGERFDPGKLTAAHKTLPIGTIVDVRRPGTGKSVRVRINDRGPFGPPDWIIDLSSAAFEHIASRREGVIPVEVEIVALPSKR